MEAYWSTGFALLAARSDAPKCHQASATPHDTPGIAFLRLRFIERVKVESMSEPVR
jgi:hypothetical protein